MNETENTRDRDIYLSLIVDALGLQKRGNASVSCATCIWILPAEQAGLPAIR